MQHWMSCLESNACGSGVAPNFHIDVSGSIMSQELQLCFYDRHVSSILGDTRSPSPELLDVRCCFNCGSPDHTLSSCPEPHNRPLITLSRQLFDFLHADRRMGEPGRFHVVEALKQQRLEWLELFQPGEVVGPALREALGLQHGDPGHHCPWLYNMSRWGYPAGWVGDTNPRDAVRQRILEGFRTVTHDNLSEDGDRSFFILSDEQDREVINLTLATLSYPNRGGDETPVTDDTSSVNSDLEPPSSTPRRWAIYPTTYFSSERLTVYNGTPLTPSTIATARPGSTFTAERKALWDTIISGSHLANTVVPPWRMPRAFQSHDENRPPPPPSTPPPLPPPPPPFPPPPVHPSLSATFTAPDDPNNSDTDMDLSDDE
jgi:zinc finger CCHC domain-containing protein 8